MLYSKEILKTMNRSIFAIKEPVFPDAFGAVLTLHKHRVGGRGWPGGAVSGARPPGGNGSRAEWAQVSVVHAGSSRAWPTIAVSHKQALVCVLE